VKLDLNKEMFDP